MAGGSPRIGGNKKTPSRTQVLAAPKTPKSSRVRSRTGQARHTGYQTGEKLTEGASPVNIDFSADPRRGRQQVMGAGPRKSEARPIGVVLDLANVRGLEALRAPAHLELDLVTLGQALETRSLDGAEVHEHVLAALLRDETEPLRIVEPLHATLCHLYYLFLLRLAPR